MRHDWSGRELFQVMVYKYLIDLAMSKMVMQLSKKGGPGFLLVVPLADEAKFA